MHDFWNGITGSEEDSFKSGIELIPDDTLATAFVDEVKYNEGDSPNFEFKWKISDGEYKNRFVWQKLYIYDQKPERAKRARNMLMLIMNKFNLRVPESVPMLQDLYPAVGKIAKILIGQYSIPKDDGTLRNGNHIKEVHSLNQNGSHVQTALTRNPNVGMTHQDDLPF